MEENSRSLASSMSLSWKAPSFFIHSRTDENTSNVLPAGDEGKEKQQVSVIDHYTDGAVCCVCVCVLCVCVVCVLCVVYGVVWCGVLCVLCVCVCVCVCVC